MSASRNPAPPVEVTAVPITIDGRPIGDLLVRPGTDQELIAQAIDQLTALSAWSRLGAELAALGGHHLAIAARAAMAAAREAADDPPEAARRA
ncbi:MAG TPA: hypothetical protein VN253_17640 [Kofleriaceae bacterium]|nr:hypothetical protein [Kofleriaceae bacterium]